MTMKSLWKFWCDAKNERSANNTFNHVKKELAVAITKENIGAYHKGGFVVSFWIGHETERWNDYVVEVISLGQRLGHGWGLSGDINQQVDGWSTESRIPGIQSMQWSSGERVQPEQGDVSG